MALLGRVRERVDRLWPEDDAARGYAAMLRACRELEAIVAETGPEAARALAREHDETMPAIAEVLGTTEKVARARLLHYEHLTWRRPAVWARPVRNGPVRQECGSRAAGAGPGSGAARSGAGRGKLRQPAPGIGYRVSGIGRLMTGRR
ncbi:hypothetical protein [Streptomyces sp. cmx-4-7]|uniref:hypothetical protein n=1 Tax=Streptomyces sp. cmx-4-7 TaxID=2790939 RepID=UPI003980026C